MRATPPRRHAVAPAACGAPLPCEESLWCEALLACLPAAATTILNQPSTLAQP